MTDSRDEQEPITGSDPTNGLAGDLEGDDGGAVEPGGNRSLFDEVIGDPDGDRLAAGADADEDADSATSYSEEGKP
ncbi:hypothetical protein A0130_10780 [Leifsonia xyli]|uniref:hypothetical protein n=1 Tax=Leifsonia xyli TaxID=1575 RepID=UPI0007CDDECD|nr:hypothetical protein A0130_10780 [Leifsonia xyli]